MNAKPTVKRCALRASHEGPHMWVNTRRLGQFGECRALAPVHSENTADALCDELDTLCQAIEGYRAGALTADGLWHYVEKARAVMENVTEASHG